MLCRRPWLPCTHATRQAPSTPLVNCSQREGGAQVILEAIQSGTPVLASRISGNLGMLGAAMRVTLGRAMTPALQRWCGGARPSRIFWRCCKRNAMLALACLSRNQKGALS